MSKKTYQNIVTSALTAVIGLSLNYTSLIATASAENLQTDENKTVVSPTPEDSLAVKHIEQNFLETKLYQHQWQGKNVVTLQFKSIPLFTFISTPESDAVEQATKVAQQLEQLSQESIDATNILVEWNDKTKDYSVKYEEQELIRVNKLVRLPDSKNNLSQDALQATNRLRRLLGNAEPLTKIKGEPKKVIAKKANTTRIKNVARRNVGRSYRGQASWYGPGFHGRRTANGEVFNQNAMTAAHKTLPFGTKVQVTNLRNGRSVVVRINDRGPFTRGRIVDLSAGAARVIGLKSSGIAPVKVEVLRR